MKKLLWIGDACVSSGFARATHHTLDTLRHEFDVAVLGMNHTGDPHPYPYPVYPCYPGGDAFGIGRVKELCEKLTPDVIIVQQDPWNVPAYTKRTGAIPVIGAIAVDGLNCKGRCLNGLAHAIFWTQYGYEQAIVGGYTGPSSVIPLGVDLKIYYPQDRMAVRERLGLAGILALRGLPKDAFIVGVVGRNQQRKRLDLTIEYFAEWIHTYKITDAVLWLHVAPTGEQAYDIEQLVEYYGIANQVMIPEVEPRHGMTEEVLCRVYNAFDIMMTTTQGEGFGLPCIEGMACGIPQVVPHWSALGEWASEAAITIRCSTTSVTPNGINVLGGIADKAPFVAALNDLYQYSEQRDTRSMAGLTLVGQERFRWERIGRAVSDVAQQVAQAYQPREIEVVV